MTSQRDEEADAQEESFPIPAPLAPSLPGGEEPESIRSVLAYLHMSH